MNNSKSNKKTEDNNNYIDYYRTSNPLVKLRSIFSYRARVKMFERLMALTTPSAADLVVDVGVTPEINLPESNYFEKMYPYKHNITMTSIEDALNLEQLFEGTKFVRTAPNEPFPFSDKQFDILFCSAVLEHVGDHESQKRFLDECIRVAKKVYLTTPNRFFPVEFHTYLPFVHWLPGKFHRKVLSLLGMEFWAKTENLNLLSAKTLRSLIPVGSNAIITGNRLLGMVSNLILFIDN